MPTVVNFTDKLRMPLSNPTEDEECRLRMMTIQCIQNPVGTDFYAGRKAPPRISPPQLRPELIIRAGTYDVKPVLNVDAENHLARVIRHRCPPR